MKNKRKNNWNNKSMFRLGIERFEWVFLSTFSDLSGSEINAEPIGFDHPDWIRLVMGLRDSQAQFEFDDVNM